MPKPLPKGGFWALQAIAYEKMMKGRSRKAAKASRGLRYEWQYREGKKTTAKVGIGLAIGLGIAGIGAATHGLVIPLVVIGLAAGGLVLGQLNKAAFATLPGRKYKGSKKTRKWIEDYKEPTHLKSVKKEEERAHKTVRRAFQHYLTAWVKAQPLRKDQQATVFNSCHETVQWVTKLLHIVRHVEKARLYLVPAIYLSQDLLPQYNFFRTEYQFKQFELETLAWHGDQRCNSKRCYLDFDQEVGNARWMVWLWQTEHLNESNTKLEEAEKQVAAEVWEVIDETIAKVMPEICEYANNRYSRNIITKAWHYPTNKWERMTVSERNAFVAKEAVSVVATVISGGVGAGELLHGFEPLFEITLDAIDYAIDEKVHRIGVTTDGTDVPDADANIPRVGAKMGAGSQESLRQAAIHLLEVYSLHNWITHLKPFTTCDELLYYFHQVNKIQYHLEKFEEHLDETIEKVTKLAKRISDDIKFLRDYNAEVAKGEPGRSHAGCAGGLCFEHPNWGPVVVKPKETGHWIWKAQMGWCWIPKS